ncbi:MAG: SusC/RagA family TonB-linked outer membrane protein [Muribaculaceae bacterium]|nr:SusC/RagA family TonB-linked outer membrane protein [Muribaculaceae bacterium]
MRKLFLILMTLCAVSWSAMAQTRTYSGTVVDAGTNEPLIGATVMPIGDGQGTATDIDGNFTLTVPANVKQARFSYVGYNQQVLNLTAKMNVQLASSATSLDDVVVIAYGTGTKESLTGSVAVVGAKEIEDRPVTSVTAALEGNAPGVQVNNSTGTPGSAPAIRIRGFNSFTSSAQSPLYVVDGVVYDGSIADINPADIESMSVLKDAASCALYGNRGANGVILINTKRAKGQGKVDVNLQVRQGMYTRGLDFYDTLGPNQWMTTLLDAWTKGRVTAGAFTSYDDALAVNVSQFLPTMLESYSPYGFINEEGVWQHADANQIFNPDGTLAAKIMPGYKDLDWWKIISRTGYREEYNMNATGATEKFDVFTSIGYLKENGYMLQTDFNRFNGRLVANYNPVKYLRVGANLAATYQESQAGNADPDELNSTKNPFLTDFYAPVRPYFAHNEDGSYAYDEQHKHIWNTEGLNKGDNTAWSMRLDKNNWTTVNFNGSVYGTAIIPYGFEFTVRGTMMRSKDNGTEYSNNIIGSQAGSGGLDLTTQHIWSDTFSQTLTWNHDYGLNSIDALLSHESYSYGYDVTFLRKSGQMMPDNIGASNFESMDYSSQSKARLRTESYLGRVRYNYDQRYYAEASIRRDGTSRFSKKNRWGTFWSVGASWIISKEKFMHSLDWVDYLKLRVAYGSVGNDAAASYYSYWPTYYLGNYDNYGTLIPNAIASENIKWEATKTLDVALEGSLFNDRFTFSIGYYDKINEDLIYNVLLPISAGMIGNQGNNLRLTQNIGTMTNWGWELMFGVDIIRNRNLKWNFNIDASFNTNRIDKLPNREDIPGQALFQGKSIYEQYTYEWAGVDKATGNSLYYMNPNSPDLYKYNNGKREWQEATWKANVEAAKKDGHYFVDEHGREYTDRSQYAYRKCMGTSLPVVYGSFSTNLSWKGINFGMLFTYSLGGKSYNGNYQQLMSMGKDGAGALHKDVLKAWTHAPGNLHERNTAADGTINFHSGDIDKNGVPINNTQLSEYNTASSSQYLISNSYLTLKNINLSYDFPKKWSQALLLQNINVGVSIDNLFILAAQKGFNPQYSFSGGQGAYYVPSRVYSFQLSVKF